MLDLDIIEHHPQRVLAALRRSEFDQIEIIGQADEKEFFELCFTEKILEALAKEMPTARKKEEVPRWFILAANLSLKLHLENAFLAFERVVRCGGLLGALPPEIASKHLHPQTKEILLQCRGFNDKNHYSRKTPCDHDTLRKALKDVSAQQWMDWFNGPVQQTFAAYGFFDPAGIFVGDGSYLFVPDNPAYEGSVVMWFDEHNHPVEYEKLTAEQRKKAHRERCYKLVSLLHLRGDCRVYAALAVVPGNAHECPVLYQLVEQFVRKVGKNIIKLLILDRGFVDGKNISRCKQEWDIDVLLPMKKNMDIWEDAWALAKQSPWQALPAPIQKPQTTPSHRPEVIVRRERKRQETLATQKAQQPPADPAEVLVRTELCPIQGFTSWTECSVAIQVLLLRDVYADGHQDQWALMTTADLTNLSKAGKTYCCPFGYALSVKDRLLAAPQLRHVLQSPPLTSTAPDWQRIFPVRLGLGIDSFPHCLNCRSRHSPLASPSGLWYAFRVIASIRSLCPTTSRTTPIRKAEPP